MSNPSLSVEDNEVIKINDDDDNNNNNNNNTHICRHQCSNELNNN